MHLHMTEGEWIAKTQPTERGIQAQARRNEREGEDISLYAAPLPVPPLQIFHRKGQHQKDTR